MKVILLKSVQKVGKKDDIVEVAVGYAQHSLFPKKLAIEATPKAIEALKRHQQNILATQEIQHQLLDKAIAELNAANVIMPVKTNAQGNLFSKIHPTDIAGFLMKQYRIAIDASQMSIPEGSIKKVGPYTITVSDGGYSASFTINISHQ